MIRPLFPSQRNRPQPEYRINFDSGIWNSTRSRRHRRTPEPHVELNIPRRSRLRRTLSPTASNEPLPRLVTRKILVSRLEYIMDRPNFTTNEEKVLVHFLQNFWNRGNQQNKTPIVEFRTTEDPEEVEYVWNLDYKRSDSRNQQRGYRAPEIGSIPKPSVVALYSQPENMRASPPIQIQRQNEVPHPDASEEET